MRVKPPREKISVVVFVVPLRHHTDTTTTVPIMTMAKLSQEQVDELLYCSRAGELDDFREATIRLVSSRTGQEIDLSAEPTPQDCETVSGLLNEIQDANEARNSPLHYAAANGHTGALSHIRTCGS